MSDEERADISADERFTLRILPGEAAEPGARPTMGEIGLNQFAPYLMNRVTARWNANLADAIKTHDMTTTKMRTLAVLSISASLTINELSVYAVTEQSTLSRALDSLEDQGYVRRVPRAGDLRVRDVFLTEEGRIAFERVWPTMYDRFAEMFDGIGDEEYRGFIATLHKLLRNIRKHDI